jgi:hypothetical protein
MGVVHFILIILVQLMGWEDLLRLVSLAQHKLLAYVLMLMEI